MGIFYSIILVTNIALLFKKDSNDFKGLFEKIRAYKRVAKIIVYFYFIFLGCFMFPLSVTREYSFIFLQLMGYFYLGVCFFGLERKSTFKVFITSFSLNTIGLMFRIILEWGEHSLMQALTIFNVTVFLFIVPIYVALIHKTVLINHEF